MTRAELKAWAKEHAKKYRWEIFGASLIVGLLSGISGNITSGKNDGFSFTLSFGIDILAFIISVGFTTFMVNIINDKKHDFSMLFKKFDKTIGQTIVAYLLQVLWTFLYALLLIIPGIIKAIGYSLVPYILADDPDMSASEVLKLSEKMMMGHKSDYFVLGLSFIGWHLLAIFTLGILEIWIIPYQQVAYTKFLYDIKKNYKEA